MSDTITSPEAQLVKEKFGDSLRKVKFDRGDTFLCVDRERIAEVIEFLKDNPVTQIDYFVECLGVDYSTWTHERDFQERFEVVYNLYSTQTYRRVFVKIGVNDGQTIPTVKHIFLGAEYPEREINDLYGIIFDGNQQTERFLLPDDWVGFPLRKEYPLGGEDVVFDQSTLGPAVEDISMPHAGESFEGKTGTRDTSGR